MTVLFADLKGSMELLADRDPEEARKILDPVLDRIHIRVGFRLERMRDAVPAADNPHRASPPRVGESRV